MLAAEQTGLAAKLNTEAVISANKDTINSIKAQMGDGTDTPTTAQNQALLNQNNQTFTENHEGKEGEWEYKYNSVHLTSFLCLLKRCGSWLNLSDNIDKFINDKRQDLAYFSPKAQQNPNFQYFFLKRVKCQHALRIDINKDVQFVLQ